MSQANQIRSADAAFIECARSSGLEPLLTGGVGGWCMAPDVDADTVTGRVVLAFDTFLAGSHTRPIAKVTLDAAELYGDPSRIADLVRRGVVAAKGELIAQMKAVIARLESLP